MLLVPALLSGCGTGSQGKDGSQSRPNIIFIMTDDQAWNLLGKDGRYPFMKTPNLDQLSREGMVFQNAFVTTSLSSPSRACIMTGSYAHKHGVYINTYADPDPNVPFMPKVLQGAGYETSFIGKWHMKPGAQPREGFDYWLSFEGQGQYVNPPLNENGRDFREKGYITDILTDYAIRRIKEPGKKPFCIFLWHKAIHAPFKPAPRDSAAFADAVIPEYPNWYDTMEGKPEWLRRGWLYGVHNEVWKNSKGKPVPQNIEPRPWDPKNPTSMNYLRAMLAVDESYGRIRQCLEELGILDNTVVIFSSDNGYFVGSHQRGDKRLMYEESIRVPLMVRYPKMVKAGTTNSDMVLNIDLAPTIIDLAGGKVPPAMQGRSMVPLMKGKSAGWRQSFFYEYFQESYAPGLVTMNGVRNLRYKYIEFPHEVNDINELYDLEKDPGEMVNLINSPSCQSIKAEMKAELERLKREYSYFDPEVYKE
jgi:N-acetylglucosamine-6-sulfatase